MNFLITIIAIISFKNFADTSNPMDLKSVLEVAKKNNPTIAVAREKIRQVESEKSLAQSYLYPNLSWNLGGTYLKDSLYTGSARFNGDPYNTYSSDFRLIQPLYTQGAISAVSYSEYDKKIQMVNVDIAERDLTQNIIEIFYRFILNQKSLENLTKNQEILQKSLGTSNSRYQKGRGLMLDVLQIKTQLALIEPQVQLAKNQIVVAGQQLINAMGESEHPNLRIKGELKVLLLKEVQKYLDMKNFNLPEYELNELQITQLDYSRDVALGKYAPSIRLVGDYQYDNYKKSDLFSDYSNSWAIQLQVTVPIFAGFASSSESSILASKNAQLRIARRELENALSLKQLSSMRNLETSETSLVSYESAVKLATNAQDEASRMYRLSQIDFLQYLSVQQAALQAQLSWDQLKYQSILAYTNYFVASGQPLSILVDILMDTKSKATL